jgi:hypothetical protein
MQSTVYADQMVIELKDFTASVILFFWGFKVDVTEVGERGSNM